ncbi:SMI1/KNR4 family protein [Mucilaginibacter gotjawali]|uniref:Uncharacterized protein n=2 Tax=Mucilaginibacter gotjawali TaxID=1550579 RepID=A0A839SKH7_9SPHI|nr:SMI1/KNR4 family protein [Mucilaginibacter gotjawali]MBB3056977.1 hypothetical protein [Mucilaginibacter gotjawali]BAU56056.1 SMI1 / KNR4 family protein [Mucilaginibacter gotjawali]
MELEKILSKYDFPKRASSLETNFEEIEKTIRFSLPEDYKYFLNNFVEHECLLGAEYLRLWDINSLLAHNKGYKIQKYLTNTLAIGTDMGGGCIAIELVEETSCRIVFMEFIGLDYPIEIGSSFTDMLKRLDNGKEWFN